MNIVAISGWIQTLGVDPENARVSSVLAGVLLLAAMAWFANWVTKSLIVRVITAIVKKTPTLWDDRLLEHHVFQRMSHVAPAIVVQVAAPAMFNDDEFLLHVSQTVVSAYLIIIALLVIDAVLNTILSFLEESSISHRVPVKSFIQAIKLVLSLFGFILLLSVLFDRNPLYFFSGLGALTAVLLLIFKDSILGLVAGVQLSVNNMIRKGDWIEMPKHGADGDVVDVTLTTIKVQNWDRTITSVPTYALISEAFKNWRGMQESGGRRIKRALYLDMQSVRFADPALLERLRKLRLLRPYIDERLDEITRWNEAHGVDSSEPYDGRQLTNIGLLRAYITAYLRQHPMIHTDLTFLVRQLAPGPTGLPIEIYVFVNDTRWAVYEGVQADIFDHLVATVPLFQLRIFQSPSGADIQSLGAALPRPG